MVRHQGTDCRKLDIHAVCSHHLGPSSWSLGNVDGTMKKTNKAALEKHLERMVNTARDVPERRPILFDAMVLVQTPHGENRTF